MPTIYLTIGNPDNKLTQEQWSWYVKDMHALVFQWSLNTHGIWFSEASSQYQNACWCLDVMGSIIPAMKRDLAHLAHTYQQDSIAWMQGTTEFILAAKDERE